MLSSLTEIIDVHLQRFLLNRMVVVTPILVVSGVLYDTLGILLIKAFMTINSILNLYLLRKEGATTNDRLNRLLSWYYIQVKTFTILHKYVSLDLYTYF